MSVKGRARGRPGAITNPLDMEESSAEKALHEDLALQWNHHQVVFLVGPPGCGRATAALQVIDFDLQIDGLELGRECPELPRNGAILIRSLDRALVFGARQGLRDLITTLSEYPPLKMLATLEHRNVPILRYLLNQPVALCKMPAREYFRAHLLEVMGENALEQISSSEALLKQHSHEALEVWLAEREVAKIFKASILDAREFAQEIGQSYTNRRGFRSWLRGLLKSDEKGAFRVFEAALRVQELPAGYRRDVFDTIFHYADPVALIEYFKWDLLSPNREILRSFVSASSSVSWFGFEDTQGAFWVHLLRLMESNLSVFSKKDKIVLSEVLEEAHRAPRLPSGCGLDLAGYLLTQTDGSLRPETTLALSRMLDSLNTPDSIRRVLEDAMLHRGHKDHGLFPSNVFRPIMARPHEEVESTSIEAPVPKLERVPENELSWTTAVLRGEAEPDLGRLRGLLNPGRDFLHAFTLCGHSAAIQIRDLWEDCFQSWVLKFAAAAVDESWENVRRDSLFELGGDRQIALVLPKLFTKDYFDDQVRVYRDMLPLALSHPIYEVRRMTAMGVAKYMDPSESIFWRCVVAFVVLDRAEEKLFSNSDEKPEILAAKHLREIFWNMEPNLKAEFQEDGHSYSEETIRCLDLALSESGVTGRELLKLEKKPAEFEAEPVPESEPDDARPSSDEIPLTTAYSILSSLRRNLDQDDRITSYLWGSFLDFVHSTGIIGLPENTEDWDDLADLLHFGVQKAPRGVDYRESVGLKGNLIKKIQGLSFSVITICRELEIPDRDRPYLELEQLRKLVELGLGLPPFLLRHLETTLAEQIPLNPMAWKLHGTPHDSVIWLLELLVEAGATEAGWVLDDYVTDHV